MYKFTQSKNGLRVLTLPMMDRQSIAMAVWVGVGSRYESEKLSGISHFLEHAVFKGTPSRSGKEIRRSIEGIGGVLNAFTGEESTCFFIKILEPYFEKAFEVMADMILNPKLDGKDLEKEKLVILEEIKMYRDLPAHQVQDMIVELLWPNQPLGRPISGSETSVKRITRKDLIGFKKSFYRRKNTLVCAAGPVNHDKLIKLSEKYFGSMRDKTKKSFAKVSSTGAGPVAKLVHKVSEQTNFVLGFKTCARTDPRRYSLSLLNVILGANMSSRLFEELREKRGLAYEIRSGVNYYSDTGSLLISAGVENNKSADAVIVTLRELKKIVKMGVPHSELRRAQDYFSSQFSMALEDTLEHLLWAGERVIESDAWPDREKILKAINAVTCRQVKSAAADFLRTDNLHLALIGPLKAADKLKIEKNLTLD